ncbi:3-hydroxyisobutyrate dehydrogenase [Dietzia sp. UCD-THP]|uniref:NAD(P)-dependent oxidoreductase n=1 Tax=Dietzia sp. UCD-THP TaxID=1292020 RepID=UPI000379EEE6|nr:3-hydroxyisobutyrate dehydrogenase [Dietzia sp. UCD-THP]
MSVNPADISGQGAGAAPVGPGSPEDSPAPVGFIGLGNMGAPIARRLLSWPGGLVVCDVRPEATEPFTAEGATSGATPAEVARTARLVSVTVLDDAQVRDVVDGPDGILRTAGPGTVVAVHSTISDSTAVELARACGTHGVHLVDAPVSGGAPGAEKGELAVMVGGTREVYEACKPVFALWAALPVHAGEVGAGTRMKLARNLLHFISFTAAAEASRLAEAAGLDIATLGRVVRHTDAITGGAGAVMLRDTTAPIAPDDFWHGVFTHVRGLGEKDLSLALDLGQRLEVDLPLGTIALRDLGSGFGVGPGEIARRAAGAPGDDGGITDDDEGAR